MLLEFSFANFLSFKYKVTFSMVATSLKDRKIDGAETTFMAGGEMPIELSRSCAVFGANASGKSNLIKAILWDWAFGIPVGIGQNHGKSGEIV